MSARSLPNFKPIVTLAPHSGIQFLDFAFTLDGSIRLSRSFLEEKGAEGDGKVLHALTAEGSDWLHPLTGAVVDPGLTYSINIQRALEPFIDRWVPVPVHAAFSAGTKSAATFSIKARRIGLASS